MGKKIVPILVCGAAVGILSSIPYISAVNLCCCAWAVVGGALCVFWYVRSSESLVTLGDAAVTGALAGLVGAIVYLLVFLPVAYFTNLPETSRRMLRDMYGAKLVDPDIDGWLILGVSALISFVMLIVMSGVGGILGQKIFEKRTPVLEPPAPPPSF